MGDLPRTALQTLAAELDHARTLLQEAMTRQKRLEQQIAGLTKRLENAQTNRDAWKTVADRERSKGRRGRSFT
jgi:predicted  nucleic acid-binding Zn-ribbon protein